MTDWEQIANDSMSTGVLSSDYKALSPTDRESVQRRIERSISDSEDFIYEKRSLHGDKHADLLLPSLDKLKFVLSACEQIDKELGC